MAEKIEPGAEPQDSGSDPFAGVAPLDPTKIKSEPGQDAELGADKLSAAEVPQNYFNPGAPILEKEKDKPAEAKPSEDEGDKSTDEEPPAEEAEPSEEEEEVAPEETTPEEGTTVDWEQNYKELRSKFNQRDEEMSQLRIKVKQVEATPDKSEELTAQLTKAQETLKEYEKWYQENYPVFQKAVEDPQLAAKLRAIQKELAQPLTSEQVRQIAREAQKEAVKEAQQSGLIDSFIDANKKAFSDPLVQERFEKEIKRYPNGFEFDKDTLDIAFEKVKRSTGYKDEVEVKKAPAKTKEDRQKKIADTQVGQGTTTTPPAAPPTNQKQSLFAAPPGSVPSSGIFG